jgi:lipopolysaccharide export system protein LptC
MSINSFIRLFPLLLLAAFSGELLYKTLYSPVKIAATSTRPDSFVTNITVLLMNPDTGKPQDQLFSPKMLHYPVDNTTDITTPHFIIFGSDPEPWDITSVYGKAKNGINTVKLWQDVKIHQAANSKNPAITMTTSELTIFPQQRIVQTQAPVRISSTSGIIHAVGLHANLNTGSISLLSKARGEYFPEAEVKNKNGH